MFFDGFLIFLNLCSILVHQTTKFDFSAHFTSLDTPGIPGGVKIVELSVVLALFQLFQFQWLRVFIHILRQILFGLF